MVIRERSSQIRLTKPALELTRIWSVEHNPGHNLQGQGNTQVNHQPPAPHETETSVRDIDLRHTELAAQCWDRTRSKALADAEGIVFNDQHWEVIVFLRNYYLAHGLPINARTTAKALNSHFYHEGGSRYLRRLFSEGPVSQGSRMAN
jgi:tRNA 2-thiouridine synthesizing protein E